MADIVWLASYPKSGNTWMRILLTNYRSGKDTPADINKLSGGPIASARMWFDEWAGVPAAALDSAAIARLRPEIYRCLARDHRERIYMKVHDAWTRTDRGEPMFPADVTAGVVYILRNPLDLAQSCAHHWGLTVEEAVARLCARDFTLAGTGFQLPEQLAQHLGGWTQHAESWLDAPGLRVHLVRYEDLLADTEAVFGEVVRFCGLPWDPDRLRTAVRFSAFGELQAQERDKGFRERPIAAPGGFFRQGQSGGWRRELSPGLAAQVMAAHGAAMRRFGYLDDQGEPIG